MIPTIAEKRLRNANLIANALKVSVIAARRLVTAIGTVRRSITHEALLDALASVAAIRKLKLIHGRQDIFEDVNKPKLLSATRRTVHFIALVGTIVLSIASPRIGNAIAIVIWRIAVVVERRHAGEVIGPTNGQRSATLAILHQHQALRT